GGKNPFQLPQPLQIVNVPDYAFIDLTKLIQYRLDPDLLPLAVLLLYQLCNNLVDTVV
ncbi:hypothetical protein JMJ77_0009084, partial [Colletotrichum scovillei]